MAAAASFKAARVYYLLDRHGLAMKYIDRAAALVDDPDVRQWRRKIEDARFGRPDARAAPSPVLPLAGAPGGATTDANAAAANVAPPGTKPAGGLLDFK